MVHYMVSPLEAHGTAPGEPPLSLTRRFSCPPPLPSPCLPSTLCLAHRFSLCPPGLHAQLDPRLPRPKQQRRRVPQQPRGINARPRKHGGGPPDPRQEVNPAPAKSPRGACQSEGLGRKRGWERGGRGQENREQDEFGGREGGIPAGVGKSVKRGIGMMGEEGEDAEHRDSPAVPCQVLRAGV